MVRRKFRQYLDFLYVALLLLKALGDSDSCTLFEVGVGREDVRSREETVCVSIHSTLI